MKLLKEKRKEGNNRHPLNQIPNQFQSLQELLPGSRRKLLYILTSYYKFYFPYTTKSDKALQVFESHRLEQCLYYWASFQGLTNMCLVRLAVHL